MPGRSGFGREYGRLASGDAPVLTYGFSIGLMSIARPYACSDQLLEPVAERQLKADVLSASIEAKSLPP